MEPHLFADHGTLATGSICGEFLNMTSPEPDALADARPELEAEREGDGLDVQRSARASSSRTARPLTAADVVATLQPADGSGRRRRSAVGVQGRSPALRRQRRGRLHRRLHARRTDGQLPVPDEQHDLPGDHPAGQLQARNVHEDPADDGGVQPHLIHARCRGEVRPQPELVGRQARRSTAST